MSISIVELRALCSQKGFAAERTICRRRFRLIDLDIGHALRNAGSTWPNSFSLREAVITLRHFDRDLAS